MSNEIVENLEDFERSLSVMARKLTVTDFPNTKVNQILISSTRVGIK